MSDTNTATFSGNLTRDAELRHTPEGKAILKFSVANTTGYGDYERTSFIDCAMFGDRAEKLAEYLKKGKPVIVTGEHVQYTWTDKETGKDRRGFELKVFSLSFQRGTKEIGSSDRMPQAAASNGHHPAASDSADDIPF